MDCFCGAVVDPYNITSEIFVFVQKKSQNTNLKFQINLKSKCPKFQTESIANFDDVSLSNICDLIFEFWKLFVILYICNLGFRALLRQVVIGIEADDYRILNNHGRPYL